MHNATDDEDGASGLSGQARSPSEQADAGAVADADPGAATNSVAAAHQTDEEELRATQAMRALRMLLNIC